MSGYPTSDPSDAPPKDELGLNDDLDPDQPWNLPYWGTRGGHPISPSYPARSLERNFSVSSTILQQTVGGVFGAQRRYPGFVAAVERRQVLQREDVYVAVVWSEGELPPDGIDGLQINDEDASEATWVVSVEHFYGSDTQPISVDLERALGAKGFVETYPGYAYSVIIIDTTKSGAPTSFAATALLKGMLITDFRTGLKVSTGNIPLVKYFILTDEEIGLGFDPTKIPTGVGSTWREAADHCDEVMGDLTRRYSFNARLTEQRPAQALAIVGDHAFMELHFVRGQYEIKSMENPATIRPEVINAGDWKSPPKWREISKKTIPNSIRVSYTNSLDWKPASVPIEDPAGVSGSNMVEAKATLSGGITRSAATRWGTKKYNHHHLERFQWMGYVPESKIAEVLPGHIITINTPEGVENQPARVERLKEMGDGWILIELTEYDPNTDSDAIATDDTPISIDGGYSTLPPDPPTNVTRELGELGNWAERSEFEDPNELTVQNHWNGFDLPDPTVVYDAINKWTKLTPTVPTGIAPSNEWLHHLAATDPGLRRYIKTTLCIALESGTDGDASIAVVYKTGNSLTGPFTERFRREITPGAVGAGTLLRWAYNIPWYLGGDTYHLIGLELSAGTNTWAVKRFHAVEWDPSPLVNGNDLDLFERWTWDDGPDWDTLVLSLQARRWNLNGSPGAVIAEVPQGENDIEFSPVPSGIVGSLGGRTIGLLGFASWAVWMWYLGTNDTVTEFPDPVTTFEIDPAPIAPTNVAMRWDRGQETGLANEDKAENWQTTGTPPSITTDVDTTPEGNVTADRVQFTAIGSIQSNDAVIDRPANSNSFVQTIWMKTYSGDPMDVTIESRIDATEYSKIVRVYGEWRLFRMPAIFYYSPLASFAGPVIKGHPADPLTPATDLIVCGAKYWTPEDDAAYLDRFTISWAPAVDAGSLDRYELQYRTQETGTVSDWITHAVIGAAADRVTFGSGPKTDAPHFPFQEVSEMAPTSSPQLYDWRIVAIRGDHVTEFEPTTVTETGLSIGGTVLGSQDFEGAPAELGLLVQTQEPDGRWVNESKRDIDIDSLIVGDLAGGDYLDIDEDGVISFFGDARPVLSRWIPAQGLKAIGESAATFVNHGISGALEFDNSQENRAVATMRLPGGLDTDEDLTIIIGWSSPAISLDCDWELNVLVTALDDDTDNTTPTVSLQQYPTSSATADGLRTALFTIPAANISADDLYLHIEIIRDGNDPNDTLNAAAHLHGLCMSYLAIAIGDSIA